MIFYKLLYGISRVFCSLDPFPLSCTPEFSLILCLIGKSLVSPVLLGLMGLYALTKSLPASSSTYQLENDILVVPNPAFIPCPLLLGTSAGLVP